MTLKEVKQEIKRLLKEKNEKNLIDLLNSCVNNEKLEKEFEDKVPENYIDDILQGEEFVPIESGKYFVSNLGRIKFNDKKNNKQPVIPQRQDSKWNWKLDKKKFYDKTIAAEEIIYDYFNMNSRTIAVAFGGNSPSISLPVAIRKGASKSCVIAWMCGGLCSLLRRNITMVMP